MRPAIRLARLRDGRTQPQSKARDPDRESRPDSHVQFMAPQGCSATARSGRDAMRDGSSCARPRQRNATQDGGSCGQALGGESIARILEMAMARREADHPHSGPGLGRWRGRVCFSSGLRLARDPDTARRQSDGPTIPWAAGSSFSRGKKGAGSLSTLLGGRGGRVAAG